MRPPTSSSAVSRAKLDHELDRSLLQEASLTDAQHDDAKKFVFRNSSSTSSFASSSASRRTSSGALDANRNMAGVFELRRWYRRRLRGGGLNNNGDCCCCPAVSPLSIETTS